MNHGKQKKNKKKKAKPAPLLEIAGAVKDETPPAMTPDDQIGTNESTCKEKSELEPMKCTCKPDGLVPVVTLLIATIAACIYGLQWREMQRSTVISNRAWVLASSPIAHKVDGGVFLTVDFKNLGKTPAMQFTGIIVGYITLPNGGTPDFDELITHYSKTEYRGIGAISPDPPDVSHLTTQTLPVDTIITTEIASGKRTVYAFGIMEYRDVFDEPRKTRFCYAFMPAFSPARLCDSEKWNSVE